MRAGVAIALGALAGVGACTIYNSGLVSSGGAGGTSSSTTSPTTSTGGTSTTAPTTGTGGSGTSTSTTAVTSTSNTTTNSTVSATSTTVGTTTATTTVATATTTATTTVAATTTASTTSATTTASTTSSSTGGGGGVLVLSQVKTRGFSGGNDEWVEIYNAGTASVVFDSSWAVSVRSATGGVATCASTGYGVRFTGGGQTIPPHGHLLYANAAGFSESATTPADGTYPTGIPDAAGVVLVHSTAIIDALCFYYDTPTQQTLACPGSPFTCEGTPVMNPHDNTTSTNDNESLERKPGGSGGNGVDTNDNASDFVTRTTADPHDLASLPVP